MQHICHNDAELYQQVFGTAMGYPVSVTVANLAMEYIEERAISIHKSLYSSHGAHSVVKSINQ